VNGHGEALQRLGIRASAGEAAEGSRPSADNAVPMFRQPRSTDRELLDGERLDADELRLNLREMAMLNRLPGGVGQSVDAVLGLLDGQTDASVLDVGTGFADFPRRLRQIHPAHVIALDSRREVLDEARRNLGPINAVTLIQADARALPLGDGSVDVTHASLLLHHLDPPDAVRALREMRRVARRGVVVNDLRRGRLAFLLTAVPVLAYTRGAYTRHDAILSARRAYTLVELDRLAAEAGLQAVWRSSSWWPRVTTVYR
jgi:SAM-dependent methyltransferase